MASLLYSNYLTVLHCLPLQESLTCVTLLPLSSSFLIISSSSFSSLNILLDNLLYSHDILPHERACISNSLLFI